MFIHLQKFLNIKQAYSIVFQTSWKKIKIL